MANEENVAVTQLGNPKLQFNMQNKKDLALSAVCTGIWKFTLNDLITY